MQIQTNIHHFLPNENLREVSGQDILTYRRYTQREFKLEFSALLKAYDGKYTVIVKQ